MRKFRYIEDRSRAWFEHIAEHCAEHGHWESTVESRSRLPGGPLSDGAIHKALWRMVEDGYLEHMKKGCYRAAKAKETING